MNKEINSEIKTSHRIFFMENVFDSQKEENDTVKSCSRRFNCPFYKEYVIKIKILKNIKRLRKRKRKSKK